LTLSFPPDGTPIFTHQSSLYASFDNLLTAAELEQAFLDAFNLWAREGNLDVGVVPDSGDAFGISGRSFGDPRFGDVRIGAYPMASDIYAIALSQKDFVSGTLSGDILFNSNAEFQNAEQFFAVALHEAGHALGLVHSDNPNSVMYPLSTNTRLSREDIANFQALYGVRRLDGYDSDNFGNNSFEMATRLEFGGEQRGEYPSIVFGDISNSQDADYFRLEIPANYSGPVSIRVLTAGISLMSPQISVFDANRQFMSGDVSTSDRGDELTITISGFADTRVYVQIAGATPGDSGSYSLITTLDDRVTVDAALIDQVARRSEFTFMNQEDVVDYLADPAGYLFNDDEHSDDDDDSAFELETEDGYALGTRFKRNASLADATDVDVYELHSLEFDPSIEFLTMIVSLRSVETGGMIPRASVFDDGGTEVASRVLVNGLGEYVIQLDALQPDENYFVHVQSDNFLAFENGNYELTISFSDQLIEFSEFVAGSIGKLNGVSSRNPKKYHSLHVAESQMFLFAFEVNPLPPNSDALLWVTVYNEQGDTIYQAASRNGERRTAHAAYFSPGSYTIEVEIAYRTGGLSTARGGIGYRLLGIEVGNPQGPEFADPTNSPFDQNGNGEYVYPDDVVSSATFVFVDGLASNLPTPPPDNPPTDLYLWYWFGT
jgi:hypothetical protein